MLLAQSGALVFTKFFDRNIVVHGAPSVVHYSTTSAAIRVHERQRIYRLKEHYNYRGSSLGVLLGGGPFMQPLSKFIVLRHDDELCMIRESDSCFSRLCIQTPPKSKATRMCQIRLPSAMMHSSWRSVAATGGEVRLIHCHQRLHLGETMLAYLAASLDAAAYRCSPAYCVSLYYGSEA